jgi:anti-sigma-K factor RskA
MDAINKEPERHEIEALLPWYAAGTLNRHDADRVEQALASDRELARRYDLVREELAETIHLNETLGAPSARAMEKLFSAIDAEEALAPRCRRQRISRTPSLATASILSQNAPCK